MIDFEAYDKAISVHTSKLQPMVNAPLMSWDLHLLNSVNRNKFNESDFKKINLIAAENKWNLNAKVSKLLSDPDVVVVTNANLDIVFASENIFAMNGYYPEEIIGKKPNMFQGHGTETAMRKKIGAAISKRKPFSAKITNYYKDGTTYICEIKGFPVFNLEGDLVNFIAFETAA